MPPSGKAKYNAIYVVVDKYSKYAWFIPCHTSYTAKDIALLYYRHVYTIAGIPRAIISDRDTRFDNKFWSELWKLLGTDLRMSTAYHPQTDGQTERVNKVLIEMLRTMVNSQHSDWSECLIACQVQYNNSKHSSTDLTPYYAVHGQEMNQPVDIMLPATTNNDSVNELINNLHNQLKLAEQRMAKSQAQQSYYANMHRRSVEYQVNDKVFVNTEHINIMNQSNKKLKQLYIGLYEITKKLENDNYIIKLPQYLIKNKVSPRFHVSDLQYYLTNIQYDRDDDIPAEPELLNDGEYGYEVERIVDHKRRYNSTWYKVKWLGWGDECNTWEPAKNLYNAKQLINDYRMNKSPDRSNKYSNKSQTITRNEQLNNALDDIDNVMNEFNNNIKHYNMNKQHERHLQCILFSLGVY